MIFKRLLLIAVSALSIATLVRMEEEEGFEGESSGYGDEDVSEDYGDSGAGGGGGGGYGGGEGGYGGYNDDPYGGGYGQGGQEEEGRALPPVIDVESLEQLQQLQAEDGQQALVVGYFDEKASADQALFEEAHAQLGRNFRFARVTRAEVLQSTKYTSAVIVHKPAAFVSDKYEKSKARFPGRSIASADVLSKFITQKAVPLAGLKTVDNSKIYEDLHLAEVTVFAEVDVERNEKQFQYFANRLRKVAVAFEDKVSFNVAHKGDFEDVLERSYGLTLPARGDVGVGLRDGSNYYKMSEKFSTESVRAFVQAWARGDLRGQEQQQAEEASHDDEEGGAAYSGPSNVVTLTPANFKTEVTDSDKDAMVEFYAPWCGHCKSLKPEYDSASHQLAGVSTVLLGAFDASEQSAPAGFEVQGFPSLFFLPGDRSVPPIPYEGAREAKAIVKFIQKHATHKFTL